MSLTIPYPTLTGTIQSGELNANFGAFSDKFGAITNSDIASTAAISTSKLAADNYESCLCFQLHGTELNTANTGFHVVGTVPYDSTNMTYTISAIETFTYAAGARTAAVYDLKFGTAAQLLAGTATTIKSSITTGAGAALWTGAALSSFTTSIATSSTPSFFILDVTTAGAAWASGDSFALTIKLKKALRT